MQPVSAPTSPQHRSNILSSPTPPLSPPLSAGYSTSSDPNFHATSLRERNAAMLNNELMADVHFNVGQLGKKCSVYIYQYKIGDH